MSDAMLNPASIPVFVGDLDQLDKDVSSLRSDAIGIRDGAVAIHSRFQMLEMHYKAPEAGDLLASTRPVSQKAEVFATDLETMADALAAFSAEARPLVAKLNRLKAEAFAFVGKAEGDDEWSYDEDMVAEHDRLLSGVNAAEAAFREAERVTASKISAIVGGTRFIEDDGSHKRTEDVVMYGVSAEALDRAEQLPWGSPVSESHHWWELDHQIKSFVWDGLIVDNIWGGIQGLGTLVGVDGFDAAGDAWGGLGDIAGGIGQYAFTPVDKVLDWTFGEDDESPTETRQKQAATDFAKSLVAWDMWDENPARASATVVFTGLTLGLAPLAGTATAGKAGAATRAAAATARAGQYLDPLYAAAQVTGRSVGALPRISEVTANLRAGFGAGADLSPHSTLELADGSKVRIADGEFIRVDADGTRIEDTAHHELAADDRAPRRKATAQPNLAGVGGGFREPGIAAGASDGLNAPTARTSESGPGRSSHASEGPTPQSRTNGSGDLPAQRRDVAGGETSPSEASSGERGGGTEPESRPATAPGQEAGGGGRGHSDPPNTDNDGLERPAEPRDGAPDASDTGNKSEQTDHGRATHLLEQPKGRGRWQAADDVPGPARDKVLRAPHPRHTLGGVKSGEVKAENSLILPHIRADVDQDIADIAAGRATFDADSQLYEANGRKYGVEPTGTVYPASGPGIVELDRIEYSALKAIARVKGDVTKLEKMFNNDPKFKNNPHAVEKAIQLYRDYGR